MKRPLILVPVVVLAACASRPVEEVRAEQATEHRDRGDEAAKLGNLEEAISSYSESLSLNPTSAETFYRRGNAYVKLRLHPSETGPRREWILQAERDYSAALRLNPAFTPAYFNRAMLRMKLKQYLEAAKDLFDVTRLETNKSEPMLRDAELYLGEIYLTKLENQQVLGMEHYDQYVKLGGDRPDVVKLVREWRELKSTMAPPAPAAPKGPTAEDEKAARELHAKAVALIQKGEEARPELAKLLDELLSKYSHTKYVRYNEKGLKALQNAFKPK
jgi:tetratricopeptide (TPR) repeat protein